MLQTDGVNTALYEKRETDMNSPVSAAGLTQPGDGASTGHLCLANAHIVLKDRVLHGAIREAF